MGVEHYRRAAKHLNTAERRLELLLRGLICAGVACIIGRLVQYMMQ